MISHPAHLRLLNNAGILERTENLIIDDLMIIHRENVFLKLGYSSLKQYCCEALGFSDDRAWTYCKIAKTCEVVPELKSAIDSGKLHISNARKIVTNLNKENAATWIPKAIDLSERKLEVEVAKVFPRTAVKEQTKPISEDVFEFRIAIKSKTETALKRCRELLAQKLSRPVSWEEAMEALTQGYLEKHDPVQKAERVLAKKSNPPSPQILVSLREMAKREPIPAFLRHQVFQRDRGACRAKLPNGKTCMSTYWPEIHHIKLLSLGGKHELSNLITLCGAHHRSIHGDNSKFYGRKSASYRYVK